MITGERPEIERLTGSFGGGPLEKYPMGNSLAVYPTARSVLRGLGEREPTWLPGAS